MGVGHGGDVRGLLPANGTIVSDAGLALAFLGCDQYDTVRTGYAIYRGDGGILSMLILSISLGFRKLTSSSQTPSTTLERVGVRTKKVSKAADLDRRGGTGLTDICDLDAGPSLPCRP